MSPFDDCTPQDEDFHRRMHAMNEFYKNALTLLCADKVDTAPVTIIDIPPAASSAGNSPTNHPDTKEVL